MKVSVVMSVYNGAKFLRDAIDSIFLQTYSDFEFIIIDDGSTDDSWKILNSYRDPRVKLIRNESNIGLTKSLNYAIRNASGQYIARIDADDISLPNRLIEEIKFLDQFHHIALVGSWTQIIDEKNNPICLRKTIASSHLLRWRLAFTNQFVHSSVMFRKEAVLSIGGYNEDLQYSQDYDLWSRLSYYWDVANIPVVLTKWRELSDNITSNKSDQQLEMGLDIARRNMTKILGYPPDTSTFENLLTLYRYRERNYDVEHINELIKNSLMLLNFFMKEYQYESKNFYKDLKEEIVKQVFRLIKINYHLKDIRLRQIASWLVKLKPNIIRIFLVFLFSRTQAGIYATRIFHPSPRS